MQTYVCANVGKDPGFSHEPKQHDRYISDPQHQRSDEKHCAKNPKSLGRALSLAHLLTSLDCCWPWQSALSTEATDVFAISTYPKFSESGEGSVIFSSYPLLSTQSDPKLYLPSFLALIVVQ